MGELHVSLINSSTVLLKLTDKLFYLRPTVFLHIEQANETPRDTAGFRNVRTALPHIFPANLGSHIVKSVFWYFPCIKVYRY